MLQSLHGAATKWVGMVLFGLLTLSFVIWGIADVFRDHVGKNIVAQVGPLEVTGQQLQNEVQREITYMRNLTGRSMTLQQALESGMVARTLNNLIDRALLEQEAQRQGLRVPTSVVLDAIRGIPDFKTETGGFDAARFKGALASIGMTEQTFLFDQRINLAREQLSAAASAVVTVPPLLQKALAAAQSEKRTVETYRVKLASQPLPATPDEATLQKYLEDNRDAFMRPAYRKLSYIKLTATDVADDIKVSDNEIAQAFETRKAELAQPEKRSFVQALTTSEEKAKLIAAAANSGKDLAAAAKANDVTTTQLTNVAKADLPADLQDAGFTLNAKDISKPIQSGLGYHILQLITVTAGHEATLDASRKKLTDDLKAQKAADALAKRSQQADDLATSGATLDEIAQNLGLKVQQMPLVDTTGKDEKGTSVTIAPEVIAAAIKLPQGQTSGLVTAPNDQYYIVHVDTLQDAALKPLTEVKQQVIAAWQKEQQQTAAQQQADKIVAALKDGKSYEAIAKDFKVEAGLEKDLLRAAPLPNYFPNDFGATVLSLKKGEVAQAPAKDSIVIARVASMTLPITVETAKTPADVSATDALKDSLTSDLFIAYSASLRQRYPVKIDEGKIAQLFIDKSQQEY